MYLLNVLVVLKVCVLRPSSQECSFTGNVVSPMAGYIPLWCGRQQASKCCLCSQLTGDAQ